MLSSYREQHAAEPDEAVRGNSKNGRQRVKSLDMTVAEGESEGPIICTGDPSYASML